LSCYIDGRVGGSGAEFINHSCDPNAVCVQKGRRVVVFSRRRIQAGEELTMYFAHPIKARRVPCLCGARKCRKTLRYIMDWSRHAYERERLEPGANSHAEIVETKSKRLKLRRISPKFTRYALGVGRSGIDSTGVYALADIPARRRVIEYTGRRLTRIEDAHLRFPKDVYVAGTPRSSIDGAVGGNGAQFINHSCDPNLTTLRTGNRMFLFSHRKIRAGEELAYRYAYPFKLRRIPCRCGARNCRKTLRLILS
jgi:SET domain-containing protein